MGVGRPDGGTLKVLPDVAVVGCRLCCVTPSVLQKFDVWEGHTTQPATGKRHARLGVPCQTPVTRSMVYKKHLIRNIVCIFENLRNKTMECKQNVRNSGTQTL